MQTDNTVKLKVNGKIFQGWLSVEITSSLQSLARTFAVSATRSRSASGDLTDGISVGDAVEVFIGDDKVLTGYVMTKTVSYSSTSVSIEISGASKPVDLEQCTMPDGYPLSYKNQTHLQNLQSVCKPYGIEVVDEVGNTKKCDFEIKPTDTISKSIIDYLKKHGLLICDNENGNIVICDTGVESAEDVLKFGSNILEGKCEQDLSKVFSQYVVLGQAANPLSELDVSSNQLKAKTTFDGINRLRANVTQLPGNSSLSELRKRVLSYRDVSIGQSEKVGYTVHGWRQSDGGLWKVNRKVVIDDRLLGLSAELLIMSVKFSLSGRGLVTNLECQKQKALDNLVVSDDTKVKKTDFGDIKVASGTVRGTKWTNA